MNWGRPLRYERRLVPAIAAALSLAAHVVPLFGGCAGPEPGALTKPRLRARRAEFALMIANGSDTRLREGAEAAPLPRPHGEPWTVERVSIAGPRPKDTRLPLQATRARLSAGRATVLPPTERVGVTAAGAGPASAGSAEGGVRAARLLRGPGKPRYPAVCRRRDLEGEGEYLVAVDETGRVSEVKVLNSAGHREFDKSARLFFLYRARYEPATLDGVPIPFALRQKVGFELERK